MWEKLKIQAHQALRWSERYTKTDMVYLTKGGGLLFVNQLIAMASGLGLSVAFAHLIPKEAFGTYQFILSLAGMIAAFSLTGLGTAITRASTQGKSKVLTQGLRTHLFWSVGMVSLAGLGAVYYFINDNSTMALGLLMVGVGLPLISGFSLYASFLNGKKDYATLTKYGIVQNVAPALILFVTIWFTDNVLLIILAYYFGNALITGLLFWQTQKAYAHEIQNDTPLINESKHLSFINAISVIADQLDKVLIFHYLGAIEVAVYTFALSPIVQLRSHSKIIKTLVLPKFTTTDVPTLKKTLPRKLLIYFAVLTAGVGAYIALAPYLFAFLFPQYSDSVIFSQALAATLLFLPIAIMRKTFIAHFKKKELYISEFTVAGITVFLLIVLLPVYGIWGAVFARIAAHVVSAVISAFLFFRLR